MGNYSRFNPVYRLPKWMDSVAGQTFLNYAYSWGASIVILGTLFKLTHMPSANFWLFLGMGTEVFVFFISAFDRPFDKTTDGMELDTEGGAVSSGIAGGSVRQNRLSPSQAPDGGLLELLNTRLGELEKMNKKLPDGTETERIREVLISIHQMYQQQVLKLSSQLTSIDRMDEMLKIQTAYMAVVNKTYRNLIRAYGAKVPHLEDYEDIMLQQKLDEQEKDNSESETEK